MIVFVAAMLLAGAGDSRHDFTQCLKEAASKAVNQKIGADGFVAFARTNCAAAEAPFAASLTSANVSHGMSKRAAASDAASQVSDYYSERLDNYKIELQPLGPEPATAVAAKQDTPSQPQ